MLCDGLEEWGGVLGEAHGEGIYVCMQLVASFCNRNQHSLGKQLYSNEK